MFGRGCWELLHSHLGVYIPDFADVRRDGTSYQAGVSPDVPAPFDPDNEDVTEARAFIEALPALLDRLPAPQSGSLAAARANARPGSESRAAARRPE
jgi:hypothetical protein